MENAGSAAGRLLQRLAEAVDPDPRRQLKRLAGRMKQEWAAEAAVLDAMLERLPLDLVRRIIYMADALQRLDAFKDAPMDPQQLARSLHAVACVSRAHRATAALTPCRAVLPMRDLWRPGKLESYLAWLAGIRLADLSLSQVAITHFQLARLAGVLATHAPGLCLSNSQLGAVAEVPGTKFDSGLLRGFGRLRSLLLDQHVAADLAALPASTTFLIFYLPGQPMSRPRQAGQQQQRPPHVLAAGTGALRPLASPPPHRLAQLHLRGALSNHNNRGGLEVEVPAAELFASAATMIVVAHTLTLLVPPWEEPRRRLGWLPAALLAVPHAVLVWASTAWRGLQLWGRHGLQQQQGRRQGQAACAYTLLPDQAEEGQAAAVEGLPRAQYRDATTGTAGAVNLQHRQAEAEQAEQQRWRRQSDTCAAAALLDSFEASGCIFASFTLTGLRLEPAQGQVAAESAAAGSSTHNECAATAGDVQQPAAAHAHEGGLEAEAEAEVEVEVEADANEQLVMCYGRLKRMLAALPRRHGTVAVVLPDTWLATAGQGGAARGADSEMFRLVLCRRSHVLEASAADPAILGGLEGLECKMRRPWWFAIKAMAGLAILAACAGYVLFVAPGPLAWFVRGVLLACAALLLLLHESQARQRAREGGAAAGQPTAVLRDLRAIGRRFRLVFF